MGISKDNTELFIKAAEEVTKQKLNSAALLVQRTAKIICPYKTSTLKRSITHKIIAAENTAIVGSNVEYAPFVEKGTSKWAGKPFLRPALAANLKAIKRIFNTI